MSQPAPANAMWKQHCLRIRQATIFCGLSPLYVAPQRLFMVWWAPGQSIEAWRVDRLAGRSAEYQQEQGKMFRVLQRHAAAAEEPAWI